MTAVWKVDKTVMMMVGSMVACWVACLGQKKAVKMVALTDVCSEPHLAASRVEV